MITSDYSPTEETITRLRDALAYKDVIINILEKETCDIHAWFKENTQAYSDYLQWHTKGQLYGLLRERETMNDHKNILQDIHDSLQNEFTRVCMFGDNTPIKESQICTQPLTDAQQQANEDTIINILKEESDNIRRWLSEDTQSYGEYLKWHGTRQLHAVIKEWKTNFPNVDHTNLPPSI